MQGRNIQPIPAFFDKEVRLKEGLILRKSQGIEVPTAPATAVTAMYLMEREKMVVHERVCAFGNRQARDAIMAAEMQPVTISNPISLGSDSPSGSSGTLSVRQGTSFRDESAGSSLDAEGSCSGLIARGSTLTPSGGGSFSDAYATSDGLLYQIVFYIAPNEMS